MINALLLEMFGAAHIASMSQSQIPAKAKNVVYGEIKTGSCYDFPNIVLLVLPFTIFFFFFAAYVTEHCEVPITDFRVTVKNLCAHTKKMFNESTSTGDSSQKRKGMAADEGSEAAQDDSLSSARASSPIPADPLSTPDLGDSGPKKRKVFLFLCIPVNDYTKAYYKLNPILSTCRLDLLYMHRSQATVHQFTLPLLLTMLWFVLFL